MKKVIVSRKALQARIAKHLKSYGQTLLLDKRMKVYYILEGEQIINSRLTLETLGQTTGLLQPFEQVEKEPLRIKLTRDRHQPRTFF
ncbi:hypothetical protein [Azotobacter salinestris]|uniref:hypothetical protein n=1 Tax=Azotobacter salinestris TaxID=69964 RepID=UPI0032E050BE